MANLVGVSHQEDVSLRNMLRTQHIGMFTLLVLEVTPPFRYAEKVGIITFDIASKYSKYISLFHLYNFATFLQLIFILREHRRRKLQR